LRSVEVPARGDVDAPDEERDRVVVLVGRQRVSGSTPPWSAVSTDVDPPAEIGVAGDGVEERADQPVGAGDRIDVARRHEAVGVPGEVGQGEVEEGDRARGGALEVADEPAHERSCPVEDEPVDLVATVVGAGGVLRAVHGAPGPVEQRELVLAA
jgi:hypothetical protein